MSSQLLKALQPITSRVRTDITAIKPKGKGSFWKRKESLTEARLLTHLNGGPARGVCPIKEGENTTMLALLDFDSHKGETPWEEMMPVLNAVVLELERRSMKSIPFRSSGGKGMHLFLIWDKPQDAYSVREFLKETIGTVGYSNGTGGVAKKQIEIFPKQDNVPVGGCGNQFILPLAGASVPLERMCDYAPMSREYILELEWPVSQDVPLVTPPIKAPRPPKQYGCSLDKLRDMLAYIDADDYDIWIKVGMALHLETAGSEEGFALYDEWSASSNSYNDGETLKKWDSFKTNKEHPITGKSIAHMAREGGWQADVTQDFDDLTVEKPLLNPKDHSGIARKLVAAKFQVQDRSLLIRTNRSWYEYRDNCYKEKDDESVRAAVRLYLDSALKLDKNGIPEPFYPAKNHVDGVFDALRSVTMLENASPPVWVNGHNDKKPQEFISLANGLLHIPTRTLLPHTPDFFTLNVLPYGWETEDEPVEWVRFLDSIWPGDKESKNTLQEMFGYFLTPDLSQHKMFLIKGPKRSGKGTIGRVLNELLGKANVCGPSLNSLAGKFGSQPLIGKLAAIIPDAQIGGRIDKQNIVEQLKMISGEDNITLDRKHIAAWTGTLTARIVMFTNEVPQLGDASGALASRFISLVMHESFYGKEDRGLQVRLLKELPQIFRWALDGRDRLNARGHFLQPKSAGDVVDSLEKLNSLITAFVSEWCELGIDYEVDKEVISKAWRHYCYDAGREHPGTKDKFCENLLNAFPTVKPRRTNRNGKRHQVFVGIRVIKSEFDEV